MTKEQRRVETVSLLQDLGLKEYEARCFLALTHLSQATAKEISDVSEVPRTRVYDAIRVLEAEGLVEVHHSSPQQFRSVDVDEATATLRRKYDDRLETLESYLERIERYETPVDPDHEQEVWSLAGAEGIESRSVDLLEATDAEILLIVVDESILTERLFDALRTADERGVDVLVGGVHQRIVAQVEAQLPTASVFETDLDWLVGGGADAEQVAIGRLLFVDRETLLLSSSFRSDRADDEPTEKAIFADGIGNGIVVLLRRLVSSGVLEIGSSSQ